MSLYRKYRPQTFEDMVGQEHIAQTLRNALSSHPPRVAHAYLFCGPRGTGKTTSARLLAKCLNCEQGPTATPCNKCEFCTRVRDNQQILDLFELDAASNRGIEDAKSLIESVEFGPSVPGHRKVYIIDEVHMLTREAFNALLKTLEEPPPYAVFVLATTDAHKVLPTVVSRCHRFDFRRVGPGDIARRLHYVARCEDVELQDEAAQLIARVADGGLRDALSLFEQVIAFSDAKVTEADVRLVLGSVSRELLKSLMDALAERDVSLALASMETASEEGVAFGQLARDLIAYSRDSLLLLMGARVAAEGEERARMSEHARKIGKARLLGFIESLRGAEKEMREATDHRLLLELALVRATTDFSAEAAPVRERVVERVVETPAERSVARVIEKPIERPQVLEPQALALVHDEPVEDQVEEDHQEELEEAEAEEEPAQVLEMPVLDAPPFIPEAAPEEFVPASWQREPIEDAAEYEAEAQAPTEAEAVEEGSAEVASVVKSSSKRGRRIHNLEEFKELWPAVFRRFKRKHGITIAAYLNDAKPVAFTETEAVLEFNKEFHYEKACEAAKRLPFEVDLNEVLATPHKLRFRLAAAKPKPLPVAEPAAVVDVDDDDEEDVIKVARELFAAQVVGRSGS